MESIYFVMSWLCHRTCEHCYEERFHPYYGADLQHLVSTARHNVPRIIDNLPERMSYFDPGDRREKRGRVIVAGGEILLEAVRESVLYPALDQLHRKYNTPEGAELIVQTTGDLLTPQLIAELLEHHVDVISVSGIDSYHAGLETEAAQSRLVSKLTDWFLAAGVQESVPAPDRIPGQKYFHFFGATPDSWIGKLWPRGRAHANELSMATIEDNFCNAWSGGRDFLEHGTKGSEVSIDPDGNVFPCCLKTKLPVGNLLERPLTDILDSLRGNPVYEAISAGQPERMGLEHGWTVDDFIAKSRTVLPSGRVYQNLCIGCDRFHKEVLAKDERYTSNDARSIPAGCHTPDDADLVQLKDGRAEACRHGHPHAEESSGRREPPLPR